MPPTTEAILAQIDSILTEAEQGLRLNGSHQWYGTNSIDQSAMRTRVEAAIQRLAPPGSAYIANVQTLSRMRVDGGAIPPLLGVLRALRADFEAGHLAVIEELVRAEVFADFLDMADELLEKGYKDAAAVIAGSVLEEHLRKLAARYGVSTAHGDRPRKADTVNADLAKAEAYNLLEQKSVTAWLGLRNDAAHGHYGNYDSGQVVALVRDVRSFMVRHAA